MAGLSLGPSNVAAYMQQIREQNMGGSPSRPNPYSGGFGGMQGSRFSNMRMAPGLTNNLPPSSSGGSQGSSQGPVMPPSIGVAPQSPSVGLPPGARSSQGPMGPVAYENNPMTPPSYTPPNPNPQGGGSSFWDRFLSNARQRQY
jgi:hypothetical protein